MSTVELGNFKLTGWRAIPLIAIVVGLFVWRSIAATSELQAEGLTELKFRLLGEYTSQNLAPLREALAAGDRAAAKRNAELLVRLEKITFPSIGSRGAGTKRVIRVEVEVDGSEPPDGQPVRYFHAEHSTLLGWRIKRKAYWWSYYLKVF